MGLFVLKCGQEADSTLKYFWVVILHLLDDIFSFDSRASRTLWPLVTRPAFLTNEYFAGRKSALCTAITFIFIYQYCFLYYLEVLCYG